MEFRLLAVAACAALVSPIPAFAQPASAAAGQEVTRAGAQASVAGRSPMTSARPHDPRQCGMRCLAALAAASALCSAPALAARVTNQDSTTMTSEHALSAKQRAIGPIAGATAVGDMPRLNAALDKGLAAGLSVSDCKEILVQLYAYTGFPRSLNALGELMKVLEARRQRGIQDAPGRDAGAIPTGTDLLALGTSNQTKLAGAPVKGPLFEFAPAIDQFLKTHLFGDIFARDNFDWQSRELATVAALAAMQGVESQLQSHVRISMNVGLTASQLRSLADALAENGQPEAARRARETVEKQVAGPAAP